MLNEKLQGTIELYHKNGFALTPLKDKRPFVSGWQNTKHKEPLDLTQFQNVKSAGWVIPKDYVVIDVDNHDNKAGSESLKKMSEHYGYDFAKNAAVRVCTASGGYHLYYRLPRGNDFTIPNSLPQFKSIEFKHTGRQVVIPNSVITDEKTGEKRGYKFHPLSDVNFTEIKLLPEELLNDLVKDSPIKKVSNLTAKAVAADRAALDHPNDIERFETMLAGIELLPAGDRNNSFYRLACEGKDLSLSRKVVFDRLNDFNLQKVHPKLEQGEVQHCINSAFKYSKNEAGTKSVALDFAAEKEIPATKELTPEQAEKQFTECIDWRTTFIFDSKGGISRTKFATKNTEIFLDNLPKFRAKLAVNLFSMDTIWRKPAPWHKPTILTGEVDRVLDDDDLIRIREALNEEGYDPTGNHILEAARAVSLRNEYHPVKEYFEALPKWDGVERLKHFFPVFCGAEDCAYSRLVGIKIFTAIVARIYNPGCKFDYLPIIIGDQGIGKSTMLEAIAIKPQWYTDNLGAIDNKDVILRMRSKLIVENAELTMFDKSDPNTVKAFLSRRVDRDRLPYDRLPRDLPRQCIIVATTNKDRFLQDETGNRRMWPIEVTKIDLPNIIAALPLFYAEAIAKFKAGEQLFLDEKEASDIALQHQADRYNTDDWEEKVASWLDEQKTDRTTILRIWDGVFHLGVDRLGFREQKRIGNILRRLGWVRKSVEIDGKIVSGFKK